MNMKKMWVPIVSSLVLVVALLALPVSAQAGPVQGADVSAIASQGPVFDASSLVHLWNELLEAIGLASGQSSQDPADPTPRKTLGPAPTEELTTLDTSIGDQEEREPSIDPIG